MALIKQHFETMLEGADGYGQVGQGHLNHGEDQASAVNVLGGDAFCGPNYDAYFADARMQTNLTHEQGLSVLDHSKAIGDIVGDGQSTVATCQGIVDGMMP
jgi:hypothetical protein